MRQKLAPAERQWQQADDACGLDVISFNSAIVEACGARDAQGEPDLDVISFRAAIASKSGGQWQRHA
eukprot:8443507-Karenia_brevis.AAC.1